MYNLLCIDDVITSVNISDHDSNQQVIKAVISNLITSLSGGTLSYGLGFMLLANTHSPLSFGIDVVVAPIITFLFFIPIGNYVDHHNHKHILTVSYILHLLLLVLFALGLPMFAKSQQLIPVITFVAFNSLIGNMLSTTYTASVHELVNQHKIAKLNSYQQACIAGGAFVAPILGVILYNITSITTFILIQFIAMVLAFLIMLTMHFHISNDSTVKPVKHHHQIQDFKIGLKYVKSRKLIMDIMIISVVINLLMSFMTVGPSYIIVDQFNLPDKVISIIDAGEAIGMIIGSLYVNRLIKKLSFFNQCFSSFLIISLCTIVMGFSFSFYHTFWPITIFGTVSFLIIAIASSLLEVSTAIRLQTTIPSKLLGRVSSMMNAINTVFMPVGTIIFTVMLKKISNDTSIFIVNGVILLSFILLYAPKFYKNIKIDDTTIAENKD